MPRRAADNRRTGIAPNRIPFDSWPFGDRPWPEKKNDLDGELELLAIELAVGVLVDQPEDRLDHLAIPVPV